MSIGTLYIIAAASGTGKTSLARALEQTIAGVKVSVSHTTRALRPQEVPNQSYFFVTEEEFTRLIKEQAFLEYAQVFGFFYGTSRAFVEQQLQQGKDVILDIDWQGAAQIKKIYPHSISIFLLPPSQEELRRRLKQRKRDSAKTIASRLALASSEIAHCNEFDYIVINDNFEEALKDLQTIFLANRLRKETQLAKYNDLLQNLLSH